MTWEEMTPEQRDALVAEKVMGWVGKECQPDPREMVLHKAEEDEPFFTYQCLKCGRVGSYDKLAYSHTSAIPHYTTSMDAAWTVMQQMGARFNPKNMYAYEPFIPFTNELFDTENEELYPSYRYMGEQIAKWTPARICLAALRAVGYEEL